MTTVLRIFGVASCALFAMSFMGGVTIAQGAAELQNGDLTPSQMHKILAQGKAGALAKARAAQTAAMAESPNGQTNYDVTFYDVSLRVNDTAETVFGTVRFVATATEDNVAVVDLDLVSSLAVHGITSPAGALTFTRTGNFVSVTLDRAYDNGETFQFDITYSGRPPTGGFKAFSFDWYGGHRSISSLSEPYFSRSWWPCKDRMDDKPDSLNSHIQVASGFYCASNGVLDSIQNTTANTRTFHYRVRYPMTTYLFSVAIAPFAVWQQTDTARDGVTTMPVIYHGYPNRFALSQSTWGQTPSMISVLAQYYGEYPFLNEKYGHANFEWGGAMEHQTCTSFTGSEYGFGTSIIVHELAHQWWGDMITCKSWHDIWLNEGWATYSEALYVLQTSGWTAYHNYMDGMAYKGPGSVYCYDTTSVGSIFNGDLSYDKGAWVCHMLRGLLGEDLFKQGIDAYYNSEFKYKAATTIDFQQLWSDATGVELGNFISEWVYGEGYPKYAYQYMNEIDPEGGYNFYMVVSQTQGTYPRVFHMPVDFYFTFSGAPGDTLTLDCNERKQHLTLHFDHPVASVSLDPKNWILHDAANYPWTFSIITLPDELAVAPRLHAYADTVETRGGSGNLSFLVSDGALPPGLTLNNSGVISGTPTVAGTYEFSVHATDLVSGRADDQNYVLTVDPGDYCCIGKVGDVNGEGGDEPTISDISRLIDMLYITLDPVACIAEGDTNQSGGYFPTATDITIGDVSELVEHLYISQQPLRDCY